MPPLDLSDLPVPKFTSVPTAASISALLADARHCHAQAIARSRTTMLDKSREAYIRLQHETTSVEPLDASNPEPESISGTFSFIASNQKLAQTIKASSTMQKGNKINEKMVKRRVQELVRTYRVHDSHDDEKKNQEDLHISSEKIKNHMHQPRVILPPFIMPEGFEVPGIPSAPDADNIQSLKQDLLQLSSNRRTEVSHSIETSLRKRHNHALQQGLQFLADPDDEEDIEKESLNLDDEEIEEGD